MRKFDFWCGFVVLYKKNVAEKIMKRKNELSFMNTAFCLIVILIHVLSAPVSGTDRQSAAYAVFFLPWRLSAFVVQGFIFLSGLKMFLGKGEKSDFIRYIISRVRKILLPYIFTVCLFYVYFLWRGYFEFDIKALAGYAVKGDLVSHFYFVIVILQFYLLKPVWKKMIRYMPPKTALVLALAVNIVASLFGGGFEYSDRLFTTYIFYWVSGCFAGDHYDEFLRYISRKKRGIVCVFAIAAIFEAVYSYVHFTRVNLMFAEQVHFLYAVLAIAFSAAAAQMFGEVVMKIGLFRRIDGASFYIYLIHPLIIFEADRLMGGYAHFTHASAFAVRATVTYTVTIALCTAYVSIKKLSRQR